MIGSVIKKKNPVSPTYSSSETMMPGRREYRPIVLHDGTVIYLYPTVISSICPINVLYFPMDTQECRIMFGSWSHSGVEVDFHPKTPTGDSNCILKQTTCPKTIHIS